MQSRARVRAALDHQEADRVPRDLGAVRMTGIHVAAYAGLRRALAMPEREVRVGDVSQQLAVVDDDVAAALRLDVRGVEPRPPSGFRCEIVDEGGEQTFVDEWGVRRRMPRSAFAFDPASAPLAGEIDAGHLARFAWPDGADPARRAGVAEDARRVIREEGRAVYVGSVCAGLTEMLFRLRGFEDGYMDLAADPALARLLMERVLEVKLAWWGAILPELGDAVDVVGEADDLGGQATPLFSPRTYRELVKPLHAELVSFIRARTAARVLFHSCGAIRELLPDLIEIGVDVLNPVQVSAAGMETAALKRDFGRDLVFWGGGVDTQGVLGSGTPDEVRAEVQGRVADLAPGGGFVFASVHNIQANVPAENVAAMWEAVEAAGAYPVGAGAAAAAGAHPAGAGAAS
ncbi:MAG: uroporphyrinogen decarboxylase family protein [Chloroflexota bacterium]